MRLLTRITLGLSLICEAAVLLPVSRNDIPLARRIYIARRNTFGNRINLSITYLGIFLVSIILVLGSGTWIPDSSKTKVEVLPPPSQEGRLFGHFRYEEANKNQLVTLAPGIALRPAAATMLKRMCHDAEIQGVKLRTLSAFRSIDLQRSVFFDIKVERNQTAAERAKVSAPPGYSEHGTGFAVDLGDGKAPETDFSKSFEDTEAFKWLSENANHYSFTLSFPPGNPQRVSYEPWHWRFEGSVDALQVFEISR
uniref:Putative carboxypeptidase n=1 Tax=Paulinella chromatophora TaxID=39717 RepID=B1X443_PAUCH|nr:putative carboxypeptidase [Paulinella chromatophora]ACB42712.1 putative carboxypeptidase [Paulinella chromatophora]